MSKMCRPRNGAGPRRTSELIHIGGLLSAAFLLVMMHGNHVGHIEDAFLIVFAVLIVIAVVRDWWLKRRGWIR